MCGRIEKRLNVGKQKKKNVIIIIIIIINCGVGVDRRVVGKTKKEKKKEMDACALDGMKALELIIIIIIVFGICFNLI